MLRFVIISLSTLGVLAAVFFLLVLRTQPVKLINAATHPAIAPTALSDVKPQSGVGPGKFPKVKNFDNGQLSSEFTADDYVPQKDGSFLFQNPQVTYYMNRGQRMIVSGDHGTMYCDSSGPAASGGLMSGPSSTPRNGTLHHVHIEFYPTPAATTPTQVMDTDNVHFDNDTYRMYSESYVDDAGKTVAAENVPVAIRGDGYEFDGTGLTMRWNAINHRLERLQIDHGHRLEIKDPNKLTLPGMAAPETTKSTAFSVNPTQHTRDLLASRVPSGRGTLGLWDGFDVTNDPQPEGVRLKWNRTTAYLIADKKPASPARIDPPTPYRAVFNDDVKITEVDRTMATADVMTVDFLQGSNKPKATAVAAAPVPASQAPSTAPAVTALTPSATTKPASTKPVNGPVTVYWTGKLVVTPIRGPAMLPLAAGQSIVRLVGTPVKLTPEGSEVQAATAVYRNPDGAVVLQNSPAFPVIHLKQDKGLTLDTGGIVYDPATSIATLAGPNELHVPVSQKQMKVTWADQGVLHVIRVPSQPNGVDRVNLSGDVVVTHPMFTLNSHQLQLNLDLIPKAGANSTDADEQLKLLTATDDVHCRLLHPNKPTEGIDSDKLVIRTERTATKQTAPREVIADGNVHAFDPDQSITAGHLDAMLVAKANATPTTKPAEDDVSSSVDLDSLYAESSVHALLKSGAAADSEKLRVTTVNGKQFVELWGPDGAKLNNQKGSWLQGPLVQITPDTSSVNVVGPGKMETIHNSSTTKPSNASPPKPINVTWADSMSLDGAANIADVHGNVFVKNTDAIGTVSTMTGDNAHIDLLDAPKSTTKQAATEPDALGSAMGGKQLKKLTLTGHVVGESQLHAADGSLARQDTLHGDQLIYNAVDGTAVVPGAGWMLVENHKADVKDVSSNRGKMAIAWKQQLSYSQTTQKIKIDGDTIVGFERDTVLKDSGLPPPLPMQLQSQHLIITLEKAPTSTTKPANDEQGKLQLSHMQSNGQVTFKARGVDLACDQIDYDPKTSLLTASGHGRTMNEAQTVSGTFDKLIYDTVKEEVLSAQGTQIKAR